MRYTIQLQNKRFIAKNRKFAVFAAREKTTDEKGGGWAHVVFRGLVPADETLDYYVWGDWINTQKYGSQLIVRTWLPAPAQEVTEADGN